ncbi:hypothetical protein [Dyella sp.]|jgi:hypothetical protein|uniref:hypothetical protein n=1 Tax=Dyella sp. TaxID=1869338 RepID=UPI002D777560|nr:hypothetical protein [Dyella sp.]HET6433875.1 hypothetical protein [Dyella sp.]
MVAGLLAVLALLAFRFRHDAGAPAPPINAAATPTQHREKPDPRLVAPPPWAPLQSSAPTLWKLGFRGHRAAAGRLFNEARQCLMARDAKDFFRGQTFDAWASSHQPYLQSLDPRARADTVAGVKSRIVLAGAYERLCGDHADAVLAHGSIYFMALSAARLGDDDATACILANAFDAPTMDPSQAAAFDREAMALGQRALTHGHWNTVLALQTVYGASGVEGQVGPVSHIDAVDYLKVLYLTAHGTPQDTPESSGLAKRIDMVTSTQGITPSQAFAARRWADETYARFFSASRSITARQVESGGCAR